MNELLILLNAYLNDELQSTSRYAIPPMPEVRVESKWARSPLKVLRLVLKLVRIVLEEVIEA